MRDLRGRVSRPFALLAGVLATAFLGVTDFLTGYEMAFSVFYMIPITLVTLTATRVEGIVVAVLSAAAWMIADLASGHRYSQWLIPYWNAVVRGAYFVVHALLLTRLIDAIRRQQELTARDPLTGTVNSLRFGENARVELERARRSRRPLTVAYIDLDNFKQVNDAQGHESGDDLLRLLVEGIQGGIRAADILGRVGGDEFALLLPETGYDEAHAVLERVRGGVVAELRRGGWPVTLSVGAVTFTVVPASFESMIKRADETMYSVKKAGKNALSHLRWPAGDPLPDAAGPGGRLP